jgi:hypothetical protein
MTTLADLESRYLASGADAAPIRHASSHVDFLISRDYFDAILTAIDGTCGPGDAIYLFSWSLQHDCPTGTGPGPDLKEILARKALAGVDVRVLLWVNANLLDFAPLVGLVDSASTSTPLGGFLGIVNLNLDSAKALREHTPTSATAGEKPLSNRVLVDHSGTVFGSHHMKGAFVLSAGEAAGFGSGMDFLESRWSGRWHDGGVKVTGTGALDVLETFRHRWDEALLLPARTYSRNGTDEPFNTTTLDTPLVTPPDTLVSGISGQSVQIARSIQPVKIGKVFGADVPWHRADWRGGRTEIRATLLKAIAAARTYIYIEDQGFDAEDTVFPALVAAAARGVKVILVSSGNDDPITGGQPLPRVTPPGVKSDLIDELDGAHRADVAFFRIAAKATDPTTGNDVDLGFVVHSKITIVDDEFCLIGSANCTDRSLQWTFWGTDSELSAAVVDDGSSVRDLRIRLWCKHLDVDPTDPTVAAAMADPATALGLFRPTWTTTPPGITAPTSRLRPTT